jgi:membrane-associated protease RseP (regulator of RpoE activity)
MLIRTLTLLTFILTARAQDAAPPLAPLFEGKITVTIDGKDEVLDLNDPATRERLQGKVIVTTEINGRRETRVVDMKDADKLPPSLMWNEKPPVRTGPVTYLGVGTVEVPECVAAQLSLAKDTGLQIAVVLPDSPAAKAGLQEGDVLHKFEDQILISPRQLAVLIANRNEGDTVKFTLVRKAEQMELNATLGKRDVPCTTETTDPVANVKREMLRLERVMGNPEEVKRLSRAELQKYLEQRDLEHREQLLNRTYRPADPSAVEDTAAAVRRALEKFPAEKRAEMEQFLIETGVLPKPVAPEANQPE